MFKKTAFKLVIALCFLSALLCASSCSAPECVDTVNDGRFTYELWGRGSLSSVRVYNSSDMSLHSVYSVKGVVFSSLTTYGLNYGFELVDMNFDGENDIRVVSSVRGGNFRYICFLYDSASDAFVSNTALASLVNFSVDADTQTLNEKKYIRTVEETLTRDEPDKYTEQHMRTEYKWTDGMLCAIRRVNMIYYSETEIYCLVTSEVTAESNGELEIIREKWIMPEKIDEYSEYFIK